MRYKGKKIGRNSPCPCGSGKKLKKCCHALAVQGKPIYNLNEAEQWEKDWQLREVMRWIEYAKTDPDAEPSEFLKRYARRHNIFLSSEHQAECRQSAAEARMILGMMGSGF